MRGLAKIPGVAGDTKKALRFCEIAAASGCIFINSRVNLHVEDGRIADAVRLIGNLADEFPGNPLLRADHARLQARLRQKPPQPAADCAASGETKESSCQTPAKSTK